MNANTPKDFLEIIQKGRTYDQAIKEAEERGVVKGKNSKIKSDKKRMSGDGIADLSGGRTRTEVQDEGDDIFDVALKPRKRIADY